MQTWPSYARFLADGYTEQRASRVVRTEMEGGPPKQAQVAKYAMRSRDGTVYLDSQADYDAFKTWVDTSLNGGADWFTWTDPTTATAKTARIVNGDYTGSRLPGGQWTVKLKLETWDS